MNYSKIRQILEKIFFVYFFKYILVLINQLSIDLKKLITSKYLKLLRGKIFCYKIHYFLSIKK